MNISKESKGEVTVVLSLIVSSVFVKIGHVQSLCFLSIKRNNYWKFIVNTFQLYFRQSKIPSSIVSKQIGLS